MIRGVRDPWRTVCCRRARRSVSWRPVGNRAAPIERDVPGEPPVLPVQHAGGGEHGALGAPRISHRAPIADVEIDQVGDADDRERAGYSCPSTVPACARRPERRGGVVADVEVLDRAEPPSRAGAPVVTDVIASSASTDDSGRVIGDLHSSGHRGESAGTRQRQPAAAESDVGMVRVDRPRADRG